MSQFQQWFNDYDAAADDEDAADDNVGHSI